MLVKRCPGVFLCDVLQETVKYQQICNVILGLKIAVDKLECRVFRVVSDVLTDQGAKFPAHLAKGRRLPLRIGIG